MALCKMEKIRIIGHREFGEGVVEELHELGLVQISDLRENLKDSPYEQFLFQEEIKDADLDRKHLELGSALDYLDGFQKRSLAESLLPAKISLNRSEFMDILHNFDYQEICRTCRKFEDKIKELGTEKLKLIRENKELLPWRRLDLPLEEINDTEQTKVIAGTISARQWEVFSQSLEESCPEVSLEVIEDTKTIKYCLIVYLKLHGETVLSLLKENGFTPLSFPALKGTPKYILEENSTRLFRIAEEKSILIDESRKFLEQKPKLAAVYDYLANLKERKNIRNFFVRTKETFLLTGWVRKRDWSKLEIDMRAKFPHLEVARISPDEGEPPPVDLENKQLVRPFEVVTNLYGFPHHREFDPTPLLAPFFFLFFGLCLTDAGYGLILISLSLLGWRKVKGGAKFFQLIFLGGIATLIAGVLTGGWFGLELGKLPFPFRYLESVVIFNPLEQPMVFFKLSLVLGFIQVWFGMIVKLVRDIKDREWMDAIFAEGSWMVIFLGILFFVLGNNVLGEREITLGKWLFIGGCFSRVFISGLVRKRKLAGMGLGLAFLLDGLKNLLGNVLSYSRLMALGMATGVIAMVINVIALLALKLPFIGWIAMIIVLIGGHLFNIAINTLGSFVHTSRLQFVEFFPYFFEGGGEPFKPFEVKNEYIKVES